MHARERRDGHAKQSERVRVAKVGLAGERQLGQCAELDAEGCEQTLALQLAELRPWQLLGGAPDHGLRGGAGQRTGSWP